MSNRSLSGGGNNGVAGASTIMERKPVANRDFRSGSSSGSPTPSSLRSNTIQKVNDCLSDAALKGIRNAILDCIEREKIVGVGTIQAAGRQVHIDDRLGFVKTLNLWNEAVTSASSASNHKSRNGRPVQTA